MWCFAVEGLLRELQKAGFEAVGYCDDIAILSRGNCVQSVMEQTQVALGIVERWCNATRLSVNPDKTQCVLFTRKRKLEIPEGPTFYGKSLTITEKVKYLGVILDRKLNWKEHMQYATKKFLNGYWLCKRTLGPTWGMRPFLVKWLYEAVLVQRLTYASLVWWTRAELRTENQSLSRLQANMLRAMVGTGRTTPKPAMGVLADVEPLHLKIKETAMRAAARLKLAGQWRGGHGGHASIVGDPCLALVNEETDRVNEELIFEKRYRIVSSTREQWKKGTHPATADTRVWYTDGSKMEGNTGSAAWEPGR